MNNEQKQRALQMLRRFEQADPMTRQADNAAVAMAALLQDLIDTPEQAAGVPDGWKLVPEKPTVDMIVDGLNARYIGGGCDEGTMARRMYTALLAAAPEAPAPAAPDADLVRDAERYRWLRAYNTAKHPSVTEAFFLGDENLDAEIDAAIAVEKGGA